MRLTQHVRTLRFCKSECACVCRLPVYMPETCCCEPIAGDAAAHVSLLKLCFFGNLAPSHQWHNADPVLPCVLQGHTTLHASALQRDCWRAPAALLGQPAAFIARHLQPQQPCWSAARQAARCSRD